MEKGKEAPLFYTISIGSPINPPNRSFTRRKPLRTYLKLKHNLLLLQLFP